MSENARIMEVVSERNTFKQELVKTTKPGDNIAYNKCLNVILYYNFMDTSTAKKNRSSYEASNQTTFHIYIQYPSPPLQNLRCQCSVINIGH
jgi:hypothetical protein